MAKKAKLKPELGTFTVNAHNIDSVIAGITKKDVAPEFIVIDLFCGAGGTSTGFEMTDGKALVIACVNHDFMAIQSHWRNYPHIAHFEEDIRTLKLEPLVRLLNYYRTLYPNAKVILWASLECTNFSKAKGGQARDADSRTLADHLDRYILALNPDYVQIENVVEFMSWGPLDDNGKPISRKNGSDYMRWCNHINSFGYYNEWKELNSADFGAYTSRNRLFGCFAKHSLPIVWPVATHQKVAKKHKLAKLQESLFNTYGPRLPWKAVKDVLDFSDEGKSIFDRNIPLSEKTLERIYAGLLKYVAGGKEAFLLKYNSTNQNGVHVPPSVDEPCPVIAVQNRLGVVNASFISKYYSGKPDCKNISTDGPAGTITCVDSQALVQAAFITQRNSGDPAGRVIDINGPARTLTSTGGNQEIVRPEFITCYNGNGGNTSMESPSPTITVADRLAVVQPKYFIDKSYSGSQNHQSIEEPAGTILTKDKYALITNRFITRQFSGGGQLSDINEPVGSLLSVPKTSIVTAEHFIMPTNYDNTPSSVEEPLSTITANRKWHYLVNPSWGGNMGDTNAPCPVIVARQDKAPLYIVNVDSLTDDFSKHTLLMDNGNMLTIESSAVIPLAMAIKDIQGNILGIAIRIDEADSTCMRKIKEFMVLYCIIDIKMRMLKVLELLKIQGFPADYKLDGNQSEQKKFIGNSVVPGVVRDWALAMCNKIDNAKSKAA